MSTDEIVHGVTLHLTGSPSLRMYRKREKPFLLRSVILIWLTIMILFYYSYQQNKNNNKIERNRNKERSFPYYIRHFISTEFYFKIGYCLM